MEIDQLRDAVKQKLENVGFTDITLEKGEFVEHVFLLSVSFQNTARTIYFYKHENLNDALVLEFCGISRQVIIYFNKLQQFIDEILVPSKKLEHFGSAAWHGWAKHYASKRTPTLLVVNHPQRKSFEHFLGIHTEDSYSILYRLFAQCPLISRSCFNEAGVKGSSWGAAQFTTAYSTNIINYEAITIDNQAMLFFVSSSYIPSQFSWCCLSNSATFPYRDILPNDLPIDLILAFEYFGFQEMMTKEELLEKICTSHTDVYYNFKALLHLISFNYEKEFKPYIEKMLSSGNIEIVNMVADTALTLNLTDATMAKTIAKMAVAKGISNNLKEQLIQKGIL